MLPSCSPCSPGTIAGAIVGIGSFHGDDLAGWRVVDHLRRDAETRSICMQKIRCPVDLLEWLSGAPLHIVDAAILPDPQHAFLRLRYNAAADREILQHVDACGTHDFGLMETLQLADALGLPTGKTVIWLVRAETVSPMQPLSRATGTAVASCTDAIRHDIMELTGPKS